jgi:outer membrane receptor for ferrienterochelin and colicin
MSNFLNLKGLLAASLIFFVSFSNAEDATSGTLEASVLDQSGTAVAGASVSVTSADTGISKSAVSSADGSVRFPLLAIGMYDVEVSASGFSSLADSVQVALGNSGYNFVLESATGSMEEIVTTAGAIQALDFNSTTTGISIDVDELIANTPINRSLTSLVLLAPGTSAGDSAFGSLASIGGSSVAENVYLVNGLNITNFRNFTGSSSVPFEFYDVVEVKTGGYQAEFGKAIGGVVNAVTKSGSNEWKAGVNVSYYPDSFYHDKPNTYSSLNDQDTRDYMEYNVSLSGPIIPDRAFFYILANPVDNQTSDTAISGNRTDSNLQEDFFGAKLDFYITEDIHLEYTFFNDDSMGENLSFDSTGTQIGTSFNNVGGDNEILKLSAVLSDRLTAAATMGKNTYERTVAGTGDACPWVWWPYPTNRPGCATSGIVSSGTDEREIFKFDVDYYIGNHHLRFGIENEDLTASDTSEYSGGVYYRGYDNDGDGTIEAGEDVRVRIYRSGGTFDVTQEAFYVQDSWDVTDKLNLI